MQSMRVPVGLALCFAFTFLTSPAVAANPSIRIMPLGDSITYGSPVAGGYRAPLYTLLTNAGYNVDFVGTQTANGAATLPDSDHEGHGGWRIDGLYNAAYGWFEAIQDPHVILLHIGTNDSANDPSFTNAVTRLNALVTRLAASQPSARIIVTSLLKRSDANYTGITNYFNPYIPGLVANQAALGRRVSFLDMHAYLSLADLADGVHPNAGGYTNMATAWLGAITNLLAADAVTPNQPVMMRALGSNDHVHVSVSLNKAVTLDTATNAANYAIDGGVTVTAADLSANRRTVTLTTSTQTAGTSYTLTVSNVADDDALTLSGQITFKGVTPRGYTNNVPESAGYRLIYSLDIPGTTGYLNSAPAYSTDNPWVDEVFSRVAYYLELQGSDGDLQYVWVSMAAFTNREDKLGVPTVATGAVYQQPVTNLNIACNVAGVSTGTGLNTGNLEFWPSNYDATNTLSIAGASDATYDYGDRRTAGTYGSMQLHNFGVGQTLFAFNNWGSSAGATPELGIGNNPSGNPDWTFTGNGGNYTVKTLQVLALPGDPVPPTLVSAQASTNYTAVAITFGKPLDAAGATNIANYAINNGVTIYSASISANQRTVTLVTSLLTGGSTYTATVNNVADQTVPTPLTIAADSQITFLAPTRRGYANNIPESSAYTLVYSLDIPTSANYGTGKVGYSVDNSAAVGPFSRVAYYLELQKPGEDLQYLWASMPAFTADAGKIGVPTVLAGALYKQTVTNMNVACNVPGVVTGSGIATGNLEFWPSNYGQANGAGLPGANGGAFDFDDSGYSLTAGHGSMQLHNYGAGQTLFALNNWNGSTLGLGIGNNTDFSKNATPYPDWTFSQNASIYSVRTLQVLILQNPALDTTAPAIVSAQAGAAGSLIRVVFSERIAAASVNGARFALNNGVSVLNATLLRDGKTVLLTTTPLPSGTTLTLTVNGIRDLCANVLPSGTTATVAVAALPASLRANVAGGLADGFQVIYAYDIPVVGDFNGSTASTLCDQSDFSGAFDRVAYYVELVLPNCTTQYLWASMSPFATSPKKLGIPTFASGEIYQQVVTNLDVKSNVSGVINGTGLLTGNIEFWPHDYSGANARSIPNASGSTCDFGDTRSAGGSYGCMQIHNYGASQTLFAMNHFGGDGNTLDLGIGNNGTGSGNPDWTFVNSNAGNANSYARRTLYVLVRPKTASDLPAEIVANVGSLANGFRRVYTFDIPVTGNFNGSSAATRHLSCLPAETFDRVAYYAELVTAAGATQYVWAAMDAFTNNETKITIPTIASGEIYQQVVTNLDVKSNVPGVVNGTGLMTGNIEFWPYNYNGANALGIPNANGGTFDFGDTRDTGGNYGCMQIHNYGASQTLFALNRFGGDGSTLDIGIGNNPSGSPDWTFASNAGNYTRRTLHILVRPNPATAADPLRAPAEVTANVPEASNWQLVYAIDLPVNGNFSNNAAAYYAVNNVTNGLATVFSRIAYYLALQSGTGPTQYVWTAVDAFTNVASALGVPTGNTVFQKRLSRLDVKSNVGGIVTGSGLDTGNIEFWPYDYATANAAAIPNADGGTYDFGDSCSLTKNYGSMQIHNYGASQTLFAVNAFNGQTLCIGIGNNTTGTGAPDWTSNNNAGSYNYRRLYVFVLPGGDTSDLTRPAILSATPSKTLSRVAVTFSETLADSAANAAFFTLNNGASVTNASLSADKKSVLLSTTVLTAGQTYTVSATGVRDRSVNGNLVVAGSSTSFTTAATSRPSALNNVPEASGYELISSLSVGNSVAYSTYGCPYSIDESLYAKPFPFDRVAYFMELSASGAATNWVYVSLDAFTADLAKIGVPTAPRGAAFKSYATNMNVYSSAGAGVTTGTGITTGLIEFWPSDYGSGRSFGLSNASDSAYDFDDNNFGTTAGHGSMQIHNHAAAQTIFAFNQYGANWRTPALGIGNRASASDPDWTFAANANTYAVKNIYVLARRGNTPSGLVTGTQPTIWTQPVAVQVLSGKPIVLNVIASGATAYQWRKDGVWIPGATQSWLTINPTAHSDSGSYDVLAFGTGTAYATSQSAEVTIKPYGTVLFFR